MSKGEFIVTELGVKFTPNNRLQKSILYQSKFEFKYADIIAVGIKLLVLIDDEMFTWVFIDKSGNTFFISPFDKIPEQDFLFILQEFNINLKDLPNHTYNQHIAGHEEIIYPHSLFGKAIFGERNFFGYLFYGLYAFFCKKHYLLNRPLSSDLVHFIKSQ